MCLKCRRHRFDPRKILWRRKWQQTPVFLPGKSHRQRSLVGYSPWGHKGVGHDLMTKQYFIVYIHHIFFIHLSVDGHLGCFQVLAIYCCNEPCSAWIFSDHVFFPDICPGVGLQGHIVSVLWDCSKLELVPMPNPLHFDLLCINISCLGLLMAAHLSLHCPPLGSVQMGIKLSWRKQALGWSFSPSDLLYPEIKSLDNKIK